MDLLKGVGHFSFWFVVGYFVFKSLHLVAKERFFIALYGPFIPFILGMVAVFPYLLATLGVVSHEQIMGGFYNLFLLYGMLNYISPIVQAFSNFHMAVILAGIAYLALLIHYIRLVKTTRWEHAQ